MIYKGPIKLKDVYVGSAEIKEVYKGSTHVYSNKLPAGIILFESGTPGTYTIDISKKCTVRIDMCGAGGAGNYLPLMETRRYTGGQGGYIYGETELSSGTYTVIVGAANEGYSSFNGNIANGGTNASQVGGGSGGSTTVVSSGLTGSNGGTSTASRILTYGGGGYGENSSGQNGYCKIVTV